MDGGAWLEEAGSWGCGLRGSILPWLAPSYYTTLLFVKKLFYYTLPTMEENSQTMN